MPVRKARLFTAVSLDGCLLDEMDWLPDTRGQSFLFDTHVWEKLEPGLEQSGNITVLSPRPVRHSGCGGVPAGAEGPGREDHLDLCRPEDHPQADEGRPDR